MRLGFEIGGGSMFVAGLERGAFKFNLCTQRDLTMEYPPVST